MTLGKQITDFILILRHRNVVKVVIGERDDIQTGPISRVMIQLVCFAFGVGRKIAVAMQIAPK